MFGLFALLNIIGKPRFETFHKSDVVQLVASGLCFGLGFGVLFGKRKFQASKAAAGMPGDPKAAPESMPGWPDKAPVPLPIRSGPPLRLLSPDGAH